MLIKTAEHGSRSLHIPTGDTFPRFEGGEWRKTFCGYALAPDDQCARGIEDSKCEVCVSEAKRVDPMPLEVKGWLQDFKEAALKVHTTRRWTRLAHHLSMNAAVDPDACYCDDRDKSDEITRVQNGDVELRWIHRNHKKWNEALLSCMDAQTVAKLRAIFRRDMSVKTNDPECGKIATYQLSKFMVEKYLVQESTRGVTVTGPTEDYLDDNHEMDGGR